MILGLSGAVAAAVCYGTATVLQAIGVRRLIAAGGGLWSKLWAGRLFGVGLLLDAVGFLASLAALRTLPLFLVQSAIAASVAVTVILAVVFLGLRLRAGEIVALAVIGGGLVALAASAAAGHAVTLTSAQSWLLLVGLLPVAAIGGLGLARRSHAAAGPSRATVALLAVGAGLGFGGVGIAARVIVLQDPWWRMASEPVLWALLGYWLLALVLYGRALAVGSVTVVAAVTFGVETVVPSAIGLQLLGDQVRPGLAVVAVLGFVATVGGCIALAGRAEIDVTHGADGPDEVYRCEPQ